MTTIEAPSWRISPRRSPQDTFRCTSKSPTALTNATSPCNPSHGAALAARVAPTMTMTKANRTIGEFPLLRQSFTAFSRRIGGAPGTMPSMRRFALAILLVPALAAADPGRLLDDHSFDTEPGGQFAGDLAFVAAKPTSLPVGLSTGLAVGFTRRCGCLFSYGARIGWSRVAEDSQSWIVTQDDFRFRLTGAIRHDAGRGSIALRL
ncbi:MAG TPA: hypothetical protein VIV58_29125, partial [Kofleriaceae bacterium]